MGNDGSVRHGLQRLNRRLTGVELRICPFLSTMLRGKPR